jgi:16S rRNA (guanine(1405)-N(7))-methyltransferase
VDELDNGQLDQLVRLVRDRPKYHTISPEMVRRIGARELGKGRKLKAAVKATRKKLHQVGGAYLASKPEYDRWLDELRDAAASSEPNALKSTCRKVMEHHVSTNERLPFLEDFYEETLGSLPRIRSVLDAACGFNPLSIPWMSLAEGATYLAYDIYTDMMEFIGSFMGLVMVKETVTVKETVAVSGIAQVHDVLTSLPNHQVDLAMILKSIPCLEQLEKDVGRRLLDSVNATYMLVSYPVLSMGKKRKGMLENYSSHFSRLVGDKNWEVRRFEFETELAFLVKK